MKKYSAEFSNSIQAAIGFLLRLKQGEKILYWHKNEKTPMPIPAWEHFSWFDSIQAAPIINHGKIEELHGSEKLTRVVSFFGYKNTLLAQIWMEGYQSINTDGSKPNFWKAIKIKYRRQFDCSRMYLTPKWFILTLTDEQCPLQ